MKAVSAGIKYLTDKQKKGEKGKDIIYKALELQNYLCPFSNIKLEDQ